jgi:hypothetical protein
MLPIALTLAGVFITFLMLVEWRSKVTRRLQHQVLGLRILSKLKGLIALIQKTPWDQRRPSPWRK